MKRGNLVVLGMVLLLGPALPLQAQESTDNENMRFVNALRQRGDNDLARVPGKDEQNGLTGPGHRAAARARQDPHGRGCRRARQYQEKHTPHRSPAGFRAIPGEKSQAPAGRRGQAGNRPGGGAAGQGAAEQGPVRRGRRSPPGRRGQGQGRPPGSRQAPQARRQGVGAIDARLGRAQDAGREGAALQARGKSPCRRAGRGA